MLIIWGFRVRSSAQGGGTFFCPNEGGDRPFSRMLAKRWFTFFWIPIFPTKTVGEFVECTSCHATYDVRVLTLPTATQMEDGLTSALRHVIVAMVLADGEVHAGERTVALQVMTRFSTRPYTESDLDEDLRTLQVADLDDELGRAAGTLSDTGREAVLRACVMLAAADGHIDESELREVTRAGQALGMSPAHVRGVLHEVVDQPRDAG